MKDLKFIQTHSVKGLTAKQKANYTRVMFAFKDDGYEDQNFVSFLHLDEKTQKFHTSATGRALMVCGLEPVRHLRGPWRIPVDGYVSHAHYLQEVCGICVFADEVLPCGKREPLSLHDLNFRFKVPLNIIGHIMMNSITDHNAYMSVDMERNVFEFMPHDFHIPYEKEKSVV